MAYFITGGTGFIGRRLVARLALRGEPIYVLVRAASTARLERLRAECAANAHLIIPLEGDLGSESLGIAPCERADLRGRITHFFHLGALYDLGAEAARLEQANVLGTRNALGLAHELQAGCFQHMSSIAVAGRYPGAFTEEMFDEAQGLEHPYFRTKHESEALVRTTCRVPWRIYRPGMVVGDSSSGVMDKVDGPYYLFKAIQRVRDALPRWVPLLGLEGGHINLVPVDFVTAALDWLAHLEGEHGQCFHLTDPVDRRIGAVLNLFADAAHAPRMTVRIEPAVLASLTDSARTSLRPFLPFVGRFLEELGIPPAVLDLLDYPTTFPPGRTARMLEQAGIAVPSLDQYAWRLWDYWERQLDRQRPDRHRLSDAVGGKTVLITGGSAGIGRASALKLADAGAKVILVARDQHKLDAAAAEIGKRGGRACTYACDITDEAACSVLLERVLAEHECIDVLINNAGRSIRRSIENSYQRLHDHERLLRINYIAAVRMTLGLLPAMVARGGGHVINISSIGVLTGAARFAAYNASKAALEAFSRCAAAEFRDRGVRFTVVNMPLVRTNMVAPTRLYERFQLLQPEQAADIVCEAIVRRPVRLTSSLGKLAQLLEALAPEFTRTVMSESYRLFPESQAAVGGCAAQPALSSDAAALAALVGKLHR